MSRPGFKELVGIAAIGLITSCSTGIQETPTPYLPSNEYPTPTEQEVNLSFYQDFLSMESILRENLDTSVNPDFWKSINSITISNVRESFDSFTFARPLPPQTTYLLTLRYQGKTALIRASEPLVGGEPKVKLLVNVKGDLVSDPSEDFIALERMKEIARNILKAVPDEWTNTEVMEKNLTGRYTVLQGIQGMTSVNNQKKLVTLSPTGSIEISPRS